jgi:hypothetical protein
MAFTNPFLRPRVSAEQVAGGNITIRAGAFGSGSPENPYAFVNPFAAAGIYSYHEGDIFLPGAQNFVFEPNFELPLVTIWGNAFLRTPNTFKPLQPPQIYANPTLVTNGVGGLQAGSVELEPLLYQGSFSEQPA